MRTRATLDLRSSPISDQSISRSTRSCMRQGHGVLLYRSTRTINRYTSYSNS